MSTATKPSEALRDYLEHAADFARAAIPEAERLERVLDKDMNYDLAGCDDAGLQSLHKRVAVECVKRGYFNEDIRDVVDQAIQADLWAREDS